MLTYADVCSTNACASVTVVVGAVGQCRQPNEYSSSISTQMSAIAARQRSPKEWTGLERFENSPRPSHRLHTLALTRHQIALSESPPPPQRSRSSACQLSRLSPSSSTGEEEGRSRGMTPSGSNSLNSRVTVLDSVKGSYRSNMKRGTANASGTPLPASLRACGCGFIST